MLAAGTQRLPRQGDGLYRVSSPSDVSNQDAARKAELIQWMACIAPQGHHDGSARPQLLSGGLGVPGVASAALFDPLVLANASTQICGSQ
ncbi:hypothetical protein [Vulcanococcus limneticus]|uniref:hypothetical protein n=1 Tax=Vulcanococcus limneticus TaxID=2170428 RepID=UPI00398C0C67